ncbi:MAG: hypothetical protein HZC42_08435 [Candidatus Eisenbacteria bacterium]|nr:hypothetical protein [Candidatus Eisenbacteria bacterium]
MKDFYFVGGPRPGREAEFFRRLKEVGGPPSGWKILRHASDDRALHLIPTASEEDIVAHLQQFGEAYEHGEIVEVLRSVE